MPLRQHHVELGDAGKRTQSAHPSKSSAASASEQNPMSEPASVPSRNDPDERASYDGRFSSKAISSATRIPFSRALTEDFEGHDGEQMPVAAEVPGMLKQLLCLTEKLFKEDLDVLSPVELPAGGAGSPAVLEPRPPGGDPKSKKSRVVNKSVRQLAGLGEDAAPASSAASQDGCSSQGLSSPPVVARATPSQMPPKTNLVFRSFPPPGLEFMQSRLERASAKEKTAHTFAPGLQMGREGPPDMWQAERPRSEMSGGFCGAPHAQDNVVEMEEALDVDYVSDVEPTSDADAEPTVVMVGPSYLASNPHVLQEVALPDHFGSVLIRSGSQRLVLSDATRLGLARGPKAPVSFGSAVHVAYGAQPSCRPCMYERWASRCSKKWLCDFCHMHPGDKRKIKGSNRRQHLPS